MRHFLTSRSIHTMHGQDSIASVLDAYAEQWQPIAAEFLGGAGGMSGARFWRLKTQHRTLCLRQWPPEHPTAARLQSIHAVLTHAVRNGFPLFPLPIPTRSRQTFVHQAGHLWQLEPWLPGEADYLRLPSREKLRAALVALAEFHRAAASYPTAERSPATAPGIVARQQQLHDLLDGGLARLESAVQPAIWPELHARAERLIGHFAKAAAGEADTLQAAARQRVPLQPCLRDVRCDHVLYVGSRVSGLIDTGAIRHESVAADIARLLGSMANDDQAAWQEGISAYESIRPLSTSERQLVDVFDRTSVLLSGMNWLDWIYQQGRIFDDHPKVIDRIDHILARLTHLPTQNK